MKNHPVYQSIVIIFLVAACSNETQNDSWSVYRGNAAGTAYSSLKEINQENAGKLSVAWTYHTLDADTGRRTAIQCNPILANGLLFVTTPRLKLVALDPASGVEKWKFDPFNPGQAAGVNRGVTYWADGNDKRVFFSAGYFLYAINADSGMPIATFGDNGRIDMRQGLGRDPEKLSVAARTPGVIFKDLIIMGSALGEGYDAAPGFVRAYDTRTGKTVWTFHTIPQPGEAGYETWTADAYKEIGGTNCWTGMTVDAERGMVFIPTGSPAFDFYGGNRKGKNLYGNCLLALDAATGTVKWYYQLVHHDLWDYDLPSSPALVTVTHEGKRIDAVAQTTKQGVVFLFNRETGEPLFPIEERPVPKSDLLGEEVWETQPFPKKPLPFARQRFSLDDVTDISPEAHQSVLDRIKGYRMGDIFLPPSVEGVIQFPGTRGGAEWGGPAVRPDGIMFVNANEIPVAIRMRAISKDGKEHTPELRGWRLYALNNCAMCHGANREGVNKFPSLRNVSSRLSSAQIDKLLQTGRGQMPQFPNLSAEDRESLIVFLSQKEDVLEMSLSSNGSETRYVHDGWNMLLDKDGYPGVKPPWGTMNAIDLNSGELLWKVPLGEFDALTKKGIPPTGTQNLGGPIATAGGLVFVGASEDEKFRAFDQATGKTLWEYKLPAGAYATPATYSVNGKQYVVIAAGGGGIIGTHSGDTYVAFALP